MPYLQVDLDGKRKWPMVAQGLGVDEAFIAKGFLDLWEFCWREGTDKIGLLHLELLFRAPGPRAAEVLVELGFLEPTEDTRYRVKGADKYLRISEARSAGGKKAAGNLKRGKSPGSPPAPAGSQPGSTSGSRPALTPNTEHQSPNTEQKKKLPSAPPAPDGEYDEFVSKLFDAFKANRGEDLLPAGRDWSALKRLRAKRTPTEILGKWVAGLASSYGARMSNFSDLETRWNNVQAALPPPDRPTCSVEGCANPANGQVWGKFYCYGEHMQAAMDAIEQREAG